LRTEREYLGHSPDLVDLAKAGLADYFLGEQMIRKVALIGALLPLSVWAVDDNEIKACSAKTNLVERLSCYDEMSVRHGLSPAPVAAAQVQPAPDPGEWKSYNSTNPADGRTAYIATLKAGAQSSSEGRAAELWVRCETGKMEFFVDWNYFLGSSQADVTYRLNNEPPRTTTWTNSTEGRATFFPDAPVPYLMRMTTASQWSTEVTPFGGSPIKAVFDLKGASVALREIRANCGW
jgi:hypothetical protein